jgi:ceramide synthetase
MIVLKRKTERKFYEFVLHHSVAVSLILFSTMSNQIAAGTMILITHDASDIMMAFSRCFIETRFVRSWISNICYVIMTSLWIWMRIFVYPFCLLAQVYANRPTPQDLWSMISFEYGYLLSMAFVLYGMHLFWTFLILKIGIKSLSGKSYDNIHDRKVKQ